MQILQSSILSLHDEQNLASPEKTTWHSVHVLSLPTLRSVPPERLMTAAIEQPEVAAAEAASCADRCGRQEQASVPLAASR